MNTQTTSARVSAWEDDPRSFAAAKPVTRPVPVLSHPRLGIVITGRPPAPRCYERPSPAFRYWNAADSLARGARFWAAILPGDTRWTSGQDLIAMIDAGTDLNAYYDRERLCFFHAPVAGDTVYSGESPDVLCHELGHAVLDAVVPALWNSATIETAALHEAFGDISAMLSALELDSVRRAVAAETGGRLSRSSRISRLAEQLGWAIRQSRPDAVEPDCLRNAANSFFYTAPENLPPLAPAVMLSSEPHSFSRVFTAAWLDALAGMAAMAGEAAADLRGVARDAGALLVRAVQMARIAPNYFAQVAAEVLRADTDLFHRRYRAAIQRAFVGRGVLSAESAASTLASPARRRRPVAGQSRKHTAPLRLPIDGETYGLRVRQLIVEAPLADGGLHALSAAPDLGSLQPATPERASRAFVEDLLRRNRIDPGDFAEVGSQPPRSARATHALERHGRDVRLIRRLFHCPGKCV